MDKLLAKRDFESAVSVDMTDHYFGTTVKTGCERSVVTRLFAYTGGAIRQGPEYFE